MPMITADICIIGGGSAGLSLAAGAVQMGASVVLFEAAEMGGDCLNHGCVPSKSLLAAAKAAHGTSGSVDMGVTGQDAEIDFAAAKDHVQQVIAGIAPHDSVERFESLGVTVIQAAGRFTGKRQAEGGGYVVRFRYAAIATGSSAFIPPIEGLEAVDYLTNETVFGLRERPAHLLVLGGGPIGLEMAQAHRRLGCQVTVIEAQSILNREADELVSRLRAQLQDEGITFIEGIAATAVSTLKAGASGTDTKSTPPHICLELSNGQQLIGSHLLVAVGRRPNLDNLGLEAAGVRWHRGGIITGANLRSSNRRIFAMGDVAGRLQFTHMAGAHAGTVIKQMLFGLPARQAVSAVSWVTYTDPELAHVGMGENEAVEKYGRDKIRVLVADLADNDRARASLQTTGSVRLVVHKNGRLLGGSILAPGAGEMISTLTLAIGQNMKVSALAQMIIPYPTLSEAIKRAAGSFYTEALFSARTRRLVRFMMRFRPW